MNRNQELAPQQGDDHALSRDEGDDVTLVPPVDIFEDQQSLVVEAEVPGVSKERLTVHADRNSLTIEGDALIDMPSNMEALYADVHVTKYRRSFVLSSELDPNRVEASLRDGVLTLRIPKRAEYQPRKVKVQSA